MESTMANVDLGRYRKIVQMFWDPEPSNDPLLDQPVWCLGQSYKLNKGCRPRATSPENHEDRNSKETRDTAIIAPDPSKATTLPNNAPDTPPESTGGSFCSVDQSEAGQENGWPQSFIADFDSRFWMTYRSEFKPIPRSVDPKAASSMSLPMRIKYQLGDQGGFSTDSGWGCMIRSGQSLLANAVGMIRLGRDWRRGQRKAEEIEIVRMFADDPAAPYSIHKFVEYGSTRCGKYPGEWFGPSATSQCIKALMDANETNMRVYMTGDSPDVYEDSFMSTARGGDGVFKPTIILISTRLGIDKITPVYWEALISALQMPQSVGIAGGRPSSSHYFVGAQGNFLFYLDPHHTRVALPYKANVNDYTTDEIDSCHTSRLRRLHVQEMDPSMLIGFIIRSEKEWEEWRRGIKHVQGKAIIHVADCDPRLQDKPEGRDGAIDEVQILSDDDTGDEI
ncbi:hypothetical protein PWT90_00099 [Aphanocladium album]|nr:hypothetical protein PWT90_00099 [Aphanocladium album]